VSPLFAVLHRLPRGRVRSTELAAVCPIAGGDPPPGVVTIGPRTQT
jgi:formate dehydrogenase maturation protein FdhE